MKAQGLRCVQRSEQAGPARWRMGALEAAVVDSASGEPMCSIVLSDITQKKQNEELLWIKNRVFDLALSANSIANCDGIITELNDAFLRIWGYDEKNEVLGKPIMHFFEHPQQVVAILKVLTDEGAWEGEFQAKRKDASTFVAHGLASILRDDAGCIIGYQSAVMDVTAQKQNEQALLDLNQTLERRVSERTQELQKTLVQLHAQQRDLEYAQRLALTSEVSAGIIHQISQPLCAMSANLAVLMSQIRSGVSEGGESLEVAEDLEYAVSCMRDVITHMQTICRPDRQPHACIDLKEMVESVLSLLKEEAAYREIDLSVGFGQDVPRVAADSIQLSQVILNLVRNAFDACEARPRELRKVAIRTRAIEGGGSELSVCDSGSGISSEAMAHLFAPFYTTKKNGLGIGLRLSRTIAEAHGGTIKASNNPDGVGASFRMVLPAAHA